MAKRTVTRRSTSPSLPAPEALVPLRAVEKPLLASEYPEDGQHAYRHTCFPHLDWADLIEGWQHRDTTVRECFYALTSPVKPSDPRLSTYCWVSGSDVRVTSITLRPTAALQQWLSRNLLNIDYDRPYFELVSRGGGEWLLIAKYSKIIGSRWLRIFRTGDLPADLVALLRSAQEASCSA